MRQGVVSLAAPPSEAAGMAQLCRVKGLRAVEPTLSHAEIAEQLGVSTRVKAAVSALNSDSGAALVDRQAIVSAFIQLLRNRSVFYSLLEGGGMVRVPRATRIELATLDATAWVVGQGKPVPLSSMAIDAQSLDGRSAAALTVLTANLLRFTQTERNITAALRRAVSATVDDAFFNSVVDSSTPSEVATGDDAEAAADGIAALLEMVEPTTESSLLLAADPAIVRRMAMLRTPAGNFLFPALTPTGGNVQGVTVMPSDGVGAGNIALIDGSGIAGYAGDIEIDASGSADIEMLNAALQQDALAPAHAQLVSMFQTNSVAIRVLTEFDAMRLRANAVAMLTGVSWGAPGSGA